MVVTSVAFGEARQVNVTLTHRQGISLAAVFLLVFHRWVHAIEGVNHLDSKHKTQTIQLLF